MQLLSGGKLVTSQVLKWCVGAYASLALKDKYLPLSTEDIFFLRKIDGWMEREMDGQHPIAYFCSMDSNANIVLSAAHRRLWNV